MSDPTPDETPKNGTPSLGGPLGAPPTFRVTVTAIGGQVSVQGNAPPDVCLMILGDGVKCLANQRMQEAKQSLVLPSGPIPPTNRLRKL